LCRPFLFCFQQQRRDRPRASHPPGRDVNDTAYRE
jgi:hypothetical protein